MLSTLRRVVVLTTSFWAVGTVTYAAFYVKARLSLPGLEGYERDWDWQLLFFTLTRVPWLLLALAVVIFVEWIVLGRSRRQIKENK